MNGILHMNVRQINRALGHEVHFGGINPLEKAKQHFNGRLSWQQVYKQLGPEQTLDLMSSLPDLERVCRLFCWACLIRFDILNQLDHSENCLNTLYTYANGLSGSKDLHCAHVTCRKAGGKLDYDTQQNLRQANAALFWSLGLNEMFSPSEMLRRIEHAEKIDGSESKYTQICLTEFDELVRGVDSGQLLCSAYSES